jgi:hypothetical protein
VKQLLGNPRIVLGVDFLESPSNGNPDTTVKVKFFKSKVPFIFGQSWKKTIIVNNVPSVLGAVFLENCLNGNLDTAVKVLYIISEEPCIIGLPQRNRHILWTKLVHY